MAEKNPNVLLQQKLVCFVAMMEDTPTEGNVAYESKTGKIKVLRVKITQYPSQTKLVKTVQEAFWN